MHQNECQVRLFHILQHLHEEVVEFADALDVDALDGGVRVLDGRAKGDHVPVGIADAEETALQTDVDGHHLGLVAVFLLIDLHAGVHDGALHVGVPTGIAAGELDAAFGQFSDGDHLLA